jgi:hypothetical protein
MEGEQPGLDNDTFNGEQESLDFLLTIGPRKSTGDGA